MNLIESGLFYEIIPDLRTLDIFGFYLYTVLKVEILLKAKYINLKLMKYLKVERKQNFRLLHGFVGGGFTLISDFHSCVLLE